MTISHPPLSWCAIEKLKKNPNELEIHALVSPCHLLFDENPGFILVDSLLLKLTTQMRTACNSPYSRRMYAALVQLWGCADHQKPFKNKRCSASRVRVMKREQRE